MDDNAILNLYREGYSYRQIKSKLKLTYEDVIQTLIKYNIKNCSNPNCPNEQPQSRSNFNSDKTRDGLSSRCRDCRKKYCSKRYYTNWEKFREYGRQYYQNHREEIRQYNKQYYQNHKEELRIYAKNYYEENKSYMQEFARNYMKKYVYQYAKFHVFEPKIAYAEKVRSDPDNSELIQVRCTYCDVWFNPTNQQCGDRIKGLNGKAGPGTENRFYCSDECKESCPIYKQEEFSKSSDVGTSREVQSELRQLVFKRDNYVCQKCNTHKSNLPINVPLHCHHIEGVKWEPIESADIDMCLTVCKSCHDTIHKQEGCKYHELKCNS